MQKVSPLCMLVSGGMKVEPCCAESKGFLMHRGFIQR